MEVEFSGKVFIKQGTIYSYGGNLTFWVKDRRPGGQAALVIITGTGKVILTDKDREITFMQVEDETSYVEPVAPPGLRGDASPRATSPSASDDPGLEVLALEGRGMVALSVASKPLPLRRHPRPAGVGARRRRSSRGAAGSPRTWSRTSSSTP